MAKSTKAAQTQPPRPPLLEWIVAGLGLLGISGACWAILTHALNGSATPPDLTLVAREMRSTRSGWVVEVEAANAGDHTAAGVQIEGRLGTEIATAELDYLPAHGHAAASLRFDKDPRQGLELTVLGWREP